MPRPPKLPSALRLPGGFRVLIELAPRPCEHLDSCDDASYRTANVDLGHIIIWEGLTPRQRWIRLYHELLHAFADAQHLVGLRAEKGELG